MMLEFNKISGSKRKETASIQELHDNYFNAQVTHIISHLY